MRKFLPLTAVLVTILLIASVQPIAAASAEDAGIDHYLLLVIDGANPADRGWAEPIVLTHNRPEKIIIVDALDCNKLYMVNGKPTKMGDIYGIGGEKLLMSVINANFKLDLTRFAKTTYSGLNSVAGILGRSIDVDAMINASKSNDRSVTRREQLKFIDAVAYGFHNMTISRMFSLASAAFKYVDSNISLIQMFNLARDLIGGKLVPNDGPNLSFQL